MRARAWAGWVAAALWLVMRLVGPHAPFVWGLPVAHGVLNYFYIDWTWLALLVSMLLLRKVPLNDRAAHVAIGILSFATFIQYATSALTRYYSGHARAWDLANYVQPMWRAAHGMEMSAGVHGEPPVWADHGAFAMFLYAPLTRVAADAGTGMLLAQSAIAAVGCIFAYDLGRALTLSVPVSLSLAVFHASSRPLLHAASFDFHPECAFPALALAIVSSRARGKVALPVILSLLASTVREMAALSVGMLWTYWALRERRGRHAWVAVACMVVAAIDMAVLPRLFGSYPYASGLNVARERDLLLAIETTLLRVAATGTVGWLHPLAWLMGLPWVAAAGTSAKDAVKGIDFQYGFLFVVVSTIGTAMLFRLAMGWRRSFVSALIGTWLIVSVAISAAPGVPLASLISAQRWFTKIHEGLARHLPHDAFVTADECSASYVMERPRLGLFCKIDMNLLETQRVERWSQPVANALAADYLLVRRDCPVRGDCARLQLAEAQQRAGFGIVAQVGPFTVLARRSSARP